MSTANSHVKFIESTAFVGEGYRLDAAEGVAYGVAVCGKVSANNRDYPDDVRDRDKALYDGVQVYIDHQDGERKVREWFGEIRNPRTRVSDRKTIGDHHYPKNSQFTAEYEERAEKFPGSLGFSHVAVCETKRVNGRESITAIKKVHSVDLVARPATNKSLFESTRETPAMEQDLAEAKSKLAAVEAKLSESEKNLSAACEQITSLTTKVTEQNAKLAEAAVAALFTEAGVVPSDVQRKAVSALADPADRKALVESFKLALAGEKPVSGEKGGQSQKQAKESSPVPTDGKAFAEFIR